MGSAPPGRAAATLLLVLVSFFASTFLVAQEPRHYVFFNRERSRILERPFLAAKAFEGAQLKYTWREIEPERDRYDLDLVQRDLDTLAAHGKRLFIQLQDVSFDSSIVNVPEYLLADPSFHGGAARQIETDGRGRSVPAGWVARRWDPAVQARLHKLFAALGERFDGKIEGINLPESAVEFGSDPLRQPAGFTAESYAAALITNMKALRRAFHASVVMLYVNFMPGEWLPYEDRGYLNGILREAKQLGVALGGPDLLPYKKAQMNNGYEMIRRSGGAAPGGIAVQEGNYAHVNPKTRKRVTIHDLIEFARSYLKVTYMFWSTQEPYFTRDLLPYVETAR